VHLSRNIKSVKALLSVTIFFTALFLPLIVSATPADGPTVVDGPVAYSRHMGNDRNQHRYSMYFSINVTDPQGTSDIASVIVTGPTSITYTLTDPETDGVWNLWTPNYDTPPTTGVYTFKVTDKSGNWIEATDNITAILDYPRNVIPYHYSITSSQSPVFSWNSVSGITGYNVVVADINGNQIWYKNGITSTSVTFNDDGTATAALVNGSIHHWEVNCYDADGNTGEQDYWVTFIYSSNTTAPVLSYPLVRSAHYGDDYGKEEYVLQLCIQTSDIQGFNDIATVKVTGTGGAIYSLSDSDGDGYWDGWFSQMPSPPQLGTYIFRATDKSGNWVEKTSTLSGTMDYPRNVHPTNNAVLNTPAPVFTWDAVTGSVRNEIWVNDKTGKQIWYRGDLSGSATTATFNDNGMATEALKDGSLYTWSVKANDENSNWGEHYGRQFVYSSDISKPIIGNHYAVTYHGGDDLGNEDWGYDVWVDISDPQGTADIANVVLTAPGGEIYVLSDPENDGRYSGWPRSSAKLQLGQCQFRVTDKSGNSAIVYDTLYSWMDFARNLTPATNSVVTISTPTFSWESVAGTVFYQLHVSPNGMPPVWGGINIYSGTSVVYNYNGTGQNLKTGTIYYWDLRSFDSKGNYGYHYGNSLIYSTNGNAPVLANTSAISGHYGTDKGEESYYIHLSTSANDPQGLSDIVSVIVTGPDQKTYILNRSSDNSRFDLAFGGTTSIPVLGPYKFRISDKSANYSEVTKNINSVIDYPRNLKPKHTEIVNNVTPVFSWRQVASAVKYTIRVNSTRNSELWRMDNLTDTTVIYNQNGGAGESLKFGFSYLLSVTAYDQDGNLGEQNNRLFYCSQSTVSPIVTGNELRSRHWADGNLNEWWGIDCWVNVSDPQGLSDIDSVWLDGPESYHQKLYDDATNGDGASGDSRFTVSTGTTVPPPVGEYILKCRDKSGNLTSIKDTLKIVLDYPKNLNIPHNSIVTQQDFPITWSAISGATRYEVTVYYPDWSRTMWTSGRLKGMLSAKYNMDNTGSALTDGDAYVLVIRTDDGDWGNESEINNIRFVYRSDGRQTLYVDTLNNSGIEYGTKLKPYNTLKEAIDRTVTSDTVIVAPGIYQGGVDYIGEICLIGAGPENTIIKGGHLALRKSNTTIKGFTIKESDRSAIEVYGDQKVVIANNIISDNAGHGIVAGWNEKSTKRLFITNNTIVNNLGNGISVENTPSEVFITNNIVSHCGSGISVNAESTITNSYNIVFGNNNNYLGLQAGTGEISKDPLYTDRQKKIYTLTANSPGLDAGSPDLDKDLKDWTADADDRDPDTTRMDMGAVFLDQRLLTPDAPASVTSVSCNDLVTLKWNRVRSPYFKRYRIYAGPDASNVIQIDSTSGSNSDTTKVIAGLTHMQTYYFRISAVNRGGKTSSYSPATASRVQTGLVPRIKSKWSGDVLICYNPADSVTKYQWYKSGAAIPGATGQYITAGKQSGLYSVETVDIKGCKNMSKILTIAGNNSITAYPNPASITVSLKVTDAIEGTATVSVVSLAGKKVLEFRTKNTQGEIIAEIPVNDLEKGIYYINVVTGNKESYSTKIVVTR